MVIKMGRVAHQYPSSCELLKLLANLSIAVLWIIVKQRTILFHFLISESLIRVTLNI